MTPTALTLRWLRETGWLADVVERRLPIPGKFVTRDVFGFGDILACRADADGTTIALVQATSASNVSSRVQKATAPDGCGPNLARWLSAGGQFYVFGWSLRGPRGKRKTWGARRVAICAGEKDDGIAVSFTVKEVE